MKLACTVQVTAGVTVVSGRIPPCSTRRRILGVPGPMSLGVRPTTRSTSVGRIGGPGAGRIGAGPA